MCFFSFFFAYSAGDLLGLSMPQEDLVGVVLATKSLNMLLGVRESLHRLEVGHQQLIELVVLLV